MIGFLGDLADVLVAQPSPSLTVSQGPPAGTECGKDGKVALDEVAKGTAFEVTCLVAAADQPITINFDNQDAGIPHNIAIFKDSSATPPALATGDVVTGPIKTTYDFKALPVGSYFFHCDVHPTMTGTFAVVEGAK
jgi:plastocyanin